MAIKVHAHYYCNGDEMHLHWARLSMIKYYYHNEQFIILIIFAYRDLIIHHITPVHIPAQEKSP